MVRPPDVREALTDGGVLYYQDHMRTSEPIDYGPPEERRVGEDDLLRACLDLTVLHYREFRVGEDDHRGAYAQVVARKSSGSTQPHTDGISGRETPAGSTPDLLGVGFDPTTGYTSGTGGRAAPGLFI